MSQKDINLSPSISLIDIYGSNLILNPRASFSKYGWLPENQAQLDFLTGSPLIIAGDLPVICSNSVSTKSIISLLTKANLQFAPNRLSFDTQEEYKEIIALMLDHQKKLIVNHPHPPGEIHPEKYWIDPQVIGFLNNKANLMQLVPQGHIPKRMVIPPHEVLKASQDFKRFPLVIKAATEEPNGGGYDVIICKNKTDLKQSQKKLRICKEVVLEEFIEVKENYCVQFSIIRDGKIVYIGASEQITSPTGIYKGNWLYKKNTTPKIVVDLAHSITKTAYNLGYLGICGIDIIVSKDNRVLVIDLNFRLNGSTPALLLKESIFKNHTASILLFRNWKTQINWEKFLSVCNEAIEHAQLIPLSVYDPTEDSYRNKEYYFSGLLIGSSQEEINQKEMTLASYGII